MMRENVFIQANASPSSLYSDQNFFPFSEPPLFQKESKEQLSQIYIISIDVNVFHGLHSIIQLGLSDNSLNTLPSTCFQYLSKLDVLILRSNNLISVPRTLSHSMKMLTYLSFNTNNLTTLPQDVFKYFINLENLLLNNNNLIALDENIFQSLIKLTKLDIQNNALTSLPSFEGLKNLQYLFIGQNKLSINAFMTQNLSNLYYFSMQYCDLTQVPKGFLRPLQALNALHLLSNRLETLDAESFVGLRSLWFLNLESNVLKVLSDNLFRDLENLRVLYLSYNKLSFLSDKLFLEQKYLESLQLTHNTLTYLTTKSFHALTSLKLLSISQNQLQVLGKGILDNMPQLETILLNDNQLSQLDKTIFVNTTSLNFIDLSLNKLQQIPKFELKHLKYLNLKHNALLQIQDNSFFGLPQNSEIFVSQHEVCQCYISELVNCTAADLRSPYLTCDRLLSGGTAMVVMWIIGLNALFGNLFVLLWRIRNRYSSKVQDIFLYNLALSDTLMGAYMIAIVSADIYFGDTFPMNSQSWRQSYLCKIAGACSITSSEASILFVTLITVDRFIAMRFPIHSEKLGKQVQRGSQYAPGSFHLY